MTLKNYKKASAWALALCLTLFLGGCYSFSGINYDQEKYKTISITNFSNASGQGPASLQQWVTEDFRDYFQRNTNLRVLPQAGDFQIDGQIMGYSFSPAAIQRTNTPANQGGLDQAGANRLTITVQVRFTDTKNPANSFDQSFNSFFDFPANQDINQINKAQINQIMDRLIYNVFTKTVANW